MTKLGSGQSWFDQTWFWPKLVWPNLDLAKDGVAKLGFGQTWFWPNLVLAKFGFGQTWFGQSWPQPSTTGSCGRKGSTKPDNFPAATTGCQDLQTKWHSGLTELSVNEMRFNRPG